MNFESFERIEQTIANTRDKLLVKSVLGGDDRSFAILSSFYRKRIAAMGMSFLKNEEDTADFVQNVFIKAYNNLPQFKWESSFSTWLTRIAYNTAVNETTRRKVYEPIANEDSLPSLGMTPEEAQIREATKAAVREAVKELPEKYAVCIELYFFYDNSYEEICAITGLNMNTVKSHIFRAKKILREKLRGFYGK